MKIAAPFMGSSTRMIKMAQDDLQNMNQPLASSVKVVSGTKYHAATRMIKLQTDRKGSLWAGKQPKFAVRGEFLDALQI